MDAFLTAALYKFVDLPDFVAQREPLRNPADLDLWVSSLRQAGVRE